MTTVSIIVTQSWTSVASISDEEILLTSSCSFPIECLVTLSPTTPSTNDVGHIIPEGGYTRDHLGKGYLWCRLLITETRTEQGSVHISITPSEIVLDTHSRIHRGEFFAIESAYSGSTDTVVNVGNFDLVITATGTNYPHIAFKYGLVGDGKMFVYELEGTSRVSGGTPLSITNKKFDSTNTFTGTATLNPTVDLTNALLKTCCPILSSEVVGGRHSVGNGDFSDELIAQPLKPVLIRVTNTSGETVRVGICARAYNHSKINT